MLTIYLQVKKMNIFASFNNKEANQLLTNKKEKS